ncbi:hypothetical protein ScPMuIL_010817 [Solemya velum]
MFSTRSNPFFILVISTLSQTVPVLTDVVCRQEGTCSCSLMDGSGVIDLKTVANSDKPRFKIPGADTADKDEYFYNPCYPFSIAASHNHCTDASACRYDGVTGIYQNLALAQSAKFDYDKDIGQIFIHYRSSPQDRNLSTRVYLRCDDNNVLSLNDYSETSVNFTLSSPCVCPNGCLPVLSVGTIVIIVFSLFLLTYLCVGMLYKKAVFGAVGQELVPNHDFWVALPGLVKDGYLFFISPCLGDRVEYRYYERL